MSKRLRSPVEEPSNRPGTPVEGAGTPAVQPIYATIGTVAVVTIPLAHYADLLARAAGEAGTVPLRMAEIARTRPPAPRGRAPLPSTIERDPEVAAFLRSRFRLADTLKAAHEACVDHFGSHRTPSVSRIASFRDKVRRGA